MDEDALPEGDPDWTHHKNYDRKPTVAQVIPLSLGDSYQGFRIVGTTPDYITHYAATLAEGALWQQPMDAVLGASVARGIVKASHQGYERFGLRRAPDKAFGFWVPRAPRSPL